MLWVSRRAARTDRTRAAALMWGGWLLVAGLVLSYMSGTTHSYYSIALAPPIGALIGIGAAGLWRIRHTWFARAALAAGLAAASAWAWVLLGRSPGWYPWVRVVIVIAAVAAIGRSWPARPCGRSSARWGTALAVGTVTLAAIAGLGGPLAYSLDTAASSYSGASPSAGPSLTAAGGGPGGGAGLGRGGGGLPGRLRTAARAGPRAASAAPAAETRRSAARPSNCSRPARPITSGRRRQTAPTAPPRWNWRPAASPLWRSAASVAPTRRPASPSSRSSSPSTRSTTTSRAGVAASAAAGAARAAASAGAGFGGRGTGAGRDFADRGAGDLGGRGAAGLGGDGASTDEAQISAWVEAHFTATTVGGMTVYNITASPK